MEKRILTMRASLSILAVAAIGVITSASFAAESTERRMGVRQGPDTVFAEPVGEILPALNDAKPTGVNGRVGNELVFWGYELADGRRVEFFGCALLPDVDCAERMQRICPARTTVLETRETTGKVVRRTCQPVGVAGMPGSAPPGCHDSDNDLGILVGLVDCG